MASVRRLSAVSCLVGVLLASPVPAKTEDARPIDVVRGAGDEIQLALTQGAPQQRVLETVVDRAVGQRFDFRRIGRLVMGRHWKSAVPGQRAVVESALRRRLVDAYVTALRNAGEFEIVYSGERSSRDGKRAMVSTEIRRPNTAPLTVKYALRRATGGWRGYDIVVQGISMVGMYRAEFRGFIAERGLTALVDRLRSEIGDASG